MTTHQQSLQSQQPSAYESAREFVDKQTGLVLALSATNLQKISGKEENDIMFKANKAIHTASQHLLEVFDSLDSEQYKRLYDKLALSEKVYFTMREKSRLTELGKWDKYKEDLFEKEEKRLGKR